MTARNQQRRTREESPDLLRRLVAVGRALAETRDQRAIFRTLRDFVAEFVVFDTFLVSYLDAETSLRRCVYCWGDGVERDPSLFEPLPLNDSPMSRALVTGQPLVCDDLQTELPPGTPFYNVGADVDPRRTRSYLIVPMTSGGRTIGSIQLQSYQQGFYEIGDAVPLAAVAGHAAAALENVRLLDEAAAARRRAERAAARESTLNRVGALLYSSLDPSEVFSTATRALLAVFGAHRATFLTLSEGERALHAAYEDRRLSARSLQGQLVDLDRLPAEAVDRLRAGEALAIADVEAEAAASPAAAIFRYSGDRAGLCIPIVENGQLAGVLFVGDSQPREWEVEEVALARGVADQVAVALRQAELFLMAARSREEWERTFEAMADAVVLVDPADRVSRANRAFWSLVRADKSAIGRPLTEVLHGGDADAIADCYVCDARLAQREGTFMVSRPSRRYPFGRHFEVKLNRVESAGGRYAGMVQVVRDVTALRAAEAELASRQAILDSVLSSTTDAIALLDPEGQIAWLNATAERLAGDDSARLRGRHVAEFLGGEDRAGLDRLLARARDGELVQLERALPRGEGVLLLECAMSPVRERGRVSGLVVTARDVTERRASMERAQEGEKLRALGQLAAGVAHDFNNLLASILGHAQLLARIPSLVETPSTARKLAAIERAARDGAETVRRIQNFTRVRQEATSEVLRVRDLVEQAVDLSRPRWKDQAQARGSSIQVAIRPIDPSAAVVGNGAELREVLTNLIFNAVDAMPGGGRIELGAEERAGYVTLRVRDTGHGIADEVRRRIFEPFFTTRGPQNSGLGLAVSYGIVSRHGGMIEVESEPGNTVFTIELPSASVITPSGEEVAASRAAGLDRRVLVVDDDDAVREVVADALLEAGAEVVTAASGRQALEALARQRFDLVVTDLGMPDLSGWEVARAARRADPSLRVLLLTGWGETVTPDAANADARDAVDRILAKPIDLDVLVEAVKTC